MVALIMAARFRIEFSLNDHHSTLRGSEESEVNGRLGGSFGSAKKESTGRQGALR
jgi:hypothetical protein